MSDDLKTKHETYSLNFLQCEVANTLVKAIYVIENEAILIKDVKNGKLPISDLAAIKRSLLQQVKKMKELHDLMSSNIRKERSVVN